MAASATRARPEETISRRIRQTSANRGISLAEI
jgi:hypothetical protein